MNCKATNSWYPLYIGYSNFTMSKFHNSHVSQQSLNSPLPKFYVHSLQASGSPFRCHAKVNSCSACHYVWGPWVIFAISFNILTDTSPLSYTNPFSVADYSPSHFVITYGTHPPVPCTSRAAMLASRVTVFAHLSRASCSILPLALDQQVTSDVRKLGKYLVLEKSMEEAEFE